MHRRPCTSSILLILFALSLAQTSLPSVESRFDTGLAAQAPSSAFTVPPFRTDASYVRVDVFATANGRPITDLTADDFEVFEDGQRQTIAQFEYVNVRAAAPDIIRQEPATVAPSRAPSIDPRARVIVLFLDSAHVNDASTARIRQPLLTMLRGMLVEGDLIAVMTADMNARDLAFTHKSQLLENILERHPFWGESDRLQTPDPPRPPSSSATGRAPSPQNCWRADARSRHSTRFASSSSDCATFERNARPSLPSPADGACSGPTTGSMTLRSDGCRRFPCSHSTRAAARSPSRPVAASASTSAHRRGWS